MKDDPLTIPWYGSEPANQLGLTQCANAYLSMWRTYCVSTKLVKSWVWLFAFISPITPNILIGHCIGKGRAIFYNQCIKRHPPPALLLQLSSSYMDSQVTLVAPPPPLSILFNSYSLRHAHISLSTSPSNILYTVHTAPLNPTGSTALYICMGNRTVVVVQQNEMLPDKITFYEENGAQRKDSVRKWLKKGALPNHW